MSTTRSLFDADDPPANSRDDLGWNAQSRTSTSHARKPLTFPIPPGAPAKDCRSCGIKIFWIVTGANKRIPINGDGTSHFSTCPNAVLHRSPR